MLRARPPQASFYGSYLHHRIVPVDHLLREINQAVVFSFTRDLVKDPLRTGLEQAGGRG